MKGFLRFLKIVLAIVLLVCGCYEIYMSLGGRAAKEERVAKENAVSIGETASDKDGVDFRVTSVDDTNTVGEGYFTVSTENNFVVLSIEISNNGDDSYDVNGLDFVLVMDGKEYECDYDAVVAFENYLYIDTINPGITKDYVVVYETPVTSDQADCQLKIDYNLFTKYNNVYIDIS